MHGSRWIGIVLALASACVEAPATGTSTSALGPGDGTYEQGRFLLGKTADTIPGRLASTQFAVGGAATLGSGAGSAAGQVTGVAVTDSPTSGSCLSATVGGVVVSCAAPAFDEMTLPVAGSTTTPGTPALKIKSSTSFVTPYPGQTMTGYVVQWNSSYRMGGPPTWEPYCFGGRLAYPMAGEVRRDSRIDRTAPYITFACSEFQADGTKPSALGDLTYNGVLAKAMSWTFVTGADGHAYMAPVVTGESLHTVALGAGRANYCRNGVPHTFDATSIQIRDLVTDNLVTDVDPATYPGPSPTALPAPIDPQQFTLESVWKRGVNDTDPEVLCLSRLRWQTLPVGPRCSGSTVIDDPRHLATAYFCDDASYTKVMTKGAVVAIRSQWNDLGLWRWSHQTNGDQYATTVGFYGEATASTLPAPGYNASPLSPPEHLGTIFTIVGKTIFQANYLAQAGTFQELRSCQKPGGTDWATDLEPWLTGHGFTANCKTEGYVWSNPPASAVLTDLRMTVVELRRWRNGAGTDFVASTTSPGTSYSTLSGAAGVIGSIVAPATW